MGDSRPAEILLRAGIYNSADILKFFTGFIQNYDSQIVCKFSTNRDNLTGELIIENNSTRQLNIKMHKSLSLSLGFIGVNDLFQDMANYSNITLSENKKYIYYVDVSIMLRQLFMYTDYLFSYKNQIAELHLTNRDFNFITQTKYSVIPVQCITINSRNYSIERDKNILLSSIYFLDILGEKILFKSASVNGCLTFQL